MLVLVESSRSGAWPGPSSVGLWPKPNSGLGLARLEMKHAHSSNRQLHPVMIVKACGSKIAHPSSQRLPDPPAFARSAVGGEPGPWTDQQPVCHRIGLGRRACTQPGEP